MNPAQQVYEAAGNAGLLKLCVWQPSDGGPPRINHVGLRTPDDTVLEQLALAGDTTISYPAGIFAGLRPYETVEVDGVRFEVREVRATGDGSEMRVRLARR